jgi:hypothetical protein
LLEFAAADIQEQKADPMTERDWLDCPEPGRMLEWLHGKSSERKLRLFALACCYRINRLITNPAARAAVEFAERDVERGVLRRKRRATVEGAAQNAHQDASNKTLSSPEGVERVRGLIVSKAIEAAAAVLRSDPFYAALYASIFSSWALAWEALIASMPDSYTELPNEFKSIEERHQASLLRCIFNPFHTFSRDRTLLTPTVRTLARAAYQERILPSGELEAVRLAVLADAVEEAGCIEPAIPDHLRGPGPHVRGCFAVDLILGKD